MTFEVKFQLQLIKLSFALDTILRGFLRIPDQKGGYQQKQSYQRGKLKHIKIWVVQGFIFIYFFFCFNQHVSDFLNPWFLIQCVSFLLLVLICRLRLLAFNHLQNCHTL